MQVSGAVFAGVLEVPVSAACKMTPAKPVAATLDAPPLPDKSAPPAELLEHARLLDSVAAFTHLRDIEALDHSLVLSLAQLAAARSVSLCKRGADSQGQLETIVHCVMERDHGYRVHAIEPLTGEVAYPPLQRCLESLQPQAISDPVHGYQLIVPILREGRAIAALQIDSMQPLGPVGPLVDGFVRIYANYTALLSESERDKLTGLYNRRTFDRHLQRLLDAPLAHAASTPEERRAVAGDAPLWLAIIDIDHFKRINDNYGHIYGDEVILLLAQLMRRGFRHGDVPFRFGGEEFVVLLRAEDAGVAQAVMERFRRTVAEHRFPQVVEVTVSVGYARVGAHDYPATVLDRADKALYFAKEHGRNRVEGYEVLREAGQLGESVVAGSIDLF